MSIVVTANTKPNLAAAYATPDPKAVWIDGNRIVVYTEGDIPPQPPTQAERQAAYDLAEPLLVDLLSQAQTGINQIDAYLLIADAATNTQVRAEVKDIDQRQRRILRALARFIMRERP